MRTIVHRCHWPTCITPVPPRMWGCRKHWRMIPQILKDKLWKAYVVRQEVNKNPTMEYLQVAMEIRLWARNEIKEGRAV